MNNRARRRTLEQLIIQPDISATHREVNGLKRWNSGRHRYFCSRCSQAPLWNTLIYTCRPITTSSFLVLGYRKRGEGFCVFGQAVGCGTCLWKSVPAVQGSRWASLSVSFAFFCKAQELFHRSNNTKQPLHSISNHPRSCWEANRISFLLCFQTYLSSPNTCSNPPTASLNIHLQ